MFFNEIFTAIKENNVCTLNSLFIQSGQNMKLFNRPNKLSMTPLIFAISLTPTEKKNGTIYVNQSYFLYNCLK